jgi:glyoxylase-like metal-dependent hydrolase (beta-lactamase superfamily II)
MPYPGIYRLKLPLTGSPLKYVNVYLLPSAEGHMLIDTGWNTEDTHISLTRQLEDIGARISDIRRIVITHTHVDHYGLAAAMVRISKAQLVMHAKEKEMAQLRYRHTRRYAEKSNRQLRTGGMKETYLLEPQEMVERFDRLVGFVAPEIVCQGGETLRHAGFEFRILWTPGHSPGHICLYEPHHRLFFSGDHVLPGITSHIGVCPNCSPNPLDDYTLALQRLRHLDVGLLLPAHGSPVRGLAERVEQILKHHSHRKAEIMDIVSRREGAASAFDLVTAMSWYSRIKPVEWHFLRDFDKRLAMTEVMAHLESLVADGRLIRQSLNGLVHYRLK